MAILEAIPSQSQATHFIGQPHRLLIDGKWVESASGQTFETLNPGTEEVLTRVARGNADYGVVPIENSTEGAVNHTLDVFMDSELRICAQILMRIENHLVAKIPRGRMLELEEAAAMICWLASAENSFTTGAVFDLSGGRATY